MRRAGKCTTGTWQRGSRGEMRGSYYSPGAVRAWTRSCVSRAQMDDAGMKCALGVPPATAAHTACRDGHTGQ